MAKELIINASLPEVRIALMDDGRIQELLIERASDKGIVGNIYKGRVTRVLPGMQAAFVDVGLDKAAFLYVDDIYVHPKVMGDDAEIDEDRETTETDASDVKTADAADAQQDSSLGQTTDPNSGETLEPAEKKPSPFITQSMSAAAPATDTEVTKKIIPEVTASFKPTPVDQQMVENLYEHPHEKNGAHHARDLEGDQPTLEDRIEATEATDDSYDDDELLNEDSDEESDEESDHDLVDDADEENDEENDEDYNAEDAAEDSEGESAQVSADSGAGTASQNLTQDANAATSDAVTAEGSSSLSGLIAEPKDGQKKRFRRGRNRRRGRGKDSDASTNVNAKQNPNRFAAGSVDADSELVPESFNEGLMDRGNVDSDRASIEAGETNRANLTVHTTKVRSEFKESRARDRRIKSKNTRPRAQANISDLLKEGQEVIVQVAKDPIATKGARLTCHVSLPGRHLVCMPSIDHVGVSRRIERDDERRKLREYVERHRPRKMGFIVRTASGGKDPEAWIKQDIDYLSKIWRDIRNKSDEVSAPACVYEDLNSILRAIRDWVNEDIDRIIVDTRYHYNELLEFSDRFMPSLREKIELYQGDLPVFDAYGLSSELHRSLERKVWLKSGGYIVIDQAEALVAIDVNTGRFVGKKSLEDTILKTNLEAAEEIAYQLRLRNCGGMIIVDFIDMEREDNKMRVYRALDEALKRDRARPTIQKISELGLVEMTRKRTRDTIIRSLCEPCTHCEGKGFTKSNLTVAYEILREAERLSVDRDAKKILISAHEAVIDLLAIDLRDVVDQLEHRSNKQIFLQTVLDYHHEQFEVVTDRMQGKKPATDIARQLRIERDRSERKEKNDKQKHRESGPRESTQRDSNPVRENHQRNDSRNRHSQSHRNEDADSGQQQAASPPVSTVPKGSFVAAPKHPKTDTLDADGTVGTAASSGQSTIIAPVQRNQNYNNSSPPDEDQLAYLRAQAAQDAALASYGVVSPSVPNQNQRGGAGGRGRNQGRHQNQRNQNAGQPNRGGDPRNGSRFRHSPARFEGSTGGNSSGSASTDNIGNHMAEPTQTINQGDGGQMVPDYEVLVTPASKNEGDGSN
jgi:ribonuclease E